MPKRKSVEYTQCNNSPVLFHTIPGILSAKSNRFRSIIHDTRIWIYTHFFLFKLWSIHWSLYKLCIYDLNSNYLKHLNKSNSSLFHQVKSRTNIYQYKLDPPPPWMNHSKPLEQCASQLYILLHTKKKLEWGCTDTINSSHALNCHYNTSNKLK